MDAKPCVFCDPKNLAAGMIAETDAFYVTATKGQITDGGYTLVIPKRHSRCIGEMDATEASALLATAEYTAKSIKEAFGKEVTMFEHGIVGQTITHTHLHLVPADLDIGQRVRNDYPMAETDAMNSLRDLPRLFKVSPEKTYLFWKRPQGSFTVAWNPAVPPQYLRIVAADLLGRPERANWKTMDPQLDAKLVADTVERLKPYFAMPQVPKPKKGNC